MGRISNCKDCRYLTKKTVLGLFIIALLFCGGCGKKPSDPNEIEKAKAENVALDPEVLSKEKIEKLTQVAISQPMFGVFLGETIDSLNKRVKVGSWSKDSWEEQYIPGEKWLVLSDNPNLEQLAVFIYHRQILVIMATFSDASMSNKIAIEKQLGEKYTRRHEDFISIDNDRFKATIDGVEVEIELTYHSFITLGNTLRVSYTHKPLKEKADLEIQRQKANKVKGDL